MEPTEFLGITFRDASHVGWFVFTMTFLILIAGTCAYLVRKKNYGTSVSVLIFFGVVFASVSFKAMLQTKFGTVYDPQFSVDCIWYNALLTGVYLCGALLLTFLGQRHLRQLS